MLQNKNLIFDYFFEKLEKNYNGAYWKNFKIIQTVITFVV